MPKTLSEAEVAEFRARLCDTAARMFVEKGPEAVTMRTLARELGCSAMTPYRYFKDKQAILAAVRAKGFDELAEALKAVRYVAGDAQANAGALGRGYFDFAFARPHVYRMMFDLAQPGAERDVEDFERARHGVCAALLTAIERIGGAESAKGEEIAACQAVMSVLHGAAMLKLSGMLDRNTCPQAIGARLIMAVVATFGPERKASARNP